MPTYDYQCDACGHGFELFQSITDPVETTCPRCNKRKLRRLFGTGAAIVFKGSGFYQTDYRSDSYRKRAEADSKATSDGKSQTSKTSDAKPARARSTESGNSTSSPTKETRGRA
jgi:putative FmdB family regulatory protein